MFSKGTLSLFGRGFVVSENKKCSWKSLTMLDNKTCTHRPLYAPIISFLYTSLLQNQLYSIKYGPIIIYRINKWFPLAISLTKSLKFRKFYYVIEVGRFFVCLKILKLCLIFFFIFESSKFQRLEIAGINYLMKTLWKFHLINSFILNELLLLYRRNRLIYIIYYTLTRYKNKVSFEQIAYETEFLF